MLRQYQKMIFKTLQIPGKGTWTFGILQGSFWDSRLWLPLLLDLYQSKAFRPDLQCSIKCGSYQGSYGFSVGFCFQLKNVSRIIYQVHVLRTLQHSRLVLPGRLPIRALHQELVWWGQTPCTSHHTVGNVPLHSSASDRSNIPLCAVLIHIRKSLLMRSDTVMNSLEP